MESRESSSPIVTRAVAAALQDRYIDSYDLPWAQRAALRVLGALPQTAAQWVVPRFNAGSALHPSALDTLKIDDLAANRLKDYDDLAGQFPAVVAGVAMGGATAHLAISLGGPFLPQAFVLTLQGGSPDGDAGEYFRRSQTAALRLAQREPGIVTIQHYDPVHDGWLTRWSNHLRLKLLHLPEAYQTFLRRRLLPGGEVVYLEGRAEWLRYRAGERSIFQVGGWGAIPAQEFLAGSPRLADYARRAGLSVSRWALDGYPLESGPESEWGCEPEFAEALETFCQREGYRFTRIVFRDPNDFSRLAFHAVKRQLEKENRRPAGTFIETFSQYDATAVARSGLAPLWLISNTTDSLEYLRTMTGEFPTDAPVFFSSLATYSLTPDLAPWAGWKDALRRFDWRNIGARASHYPADARATVAWAKKLREWVAAHPNPVREKLTGAELLDLAHKLG